MYVTNLGAITSCERKDTEIVIPRTDAVLVVTQYMDLVDADGNPPEMAQLRVKCPLCGVAELQVVGDEDRESIDRSTLPQDFVFMTRERSHGPLSENDIYDMMIDAHNLPEVEHPQGW